MNRTIEAWQKVAETRFHGRVLDQAIEDLQELARQRDQFKKLALEYAGKLAAKSADALLSELEK